MQTLRIVFRTFADFNNRISLYESLRLRQIIRKDNMKFFIFICLALICMAAGYSGLFKRKFAVMMPLSVFTSILILYIAGLFGHLKLGVIVFIGVSFLLFLTGLTKSLIRREMKVYVSNVLNFGFLFFIAALCLYLLYDRRKTAFPI